ncbi:MAG: SUMF1/EgtB/PvdO family nonheme iron enzyme [Bacteroidota bacterium]
MKTATYLLLLILSTVSLHQVKANNLQIDSVSYDATTGELSFDISWENAWRLTNEYADAVWVFAKYLNANSAQWQPVQFEFTSAISFGAVQVFPERDGIYFLLNSFTSGQVSVPPTRCTVKIDESSASKFLNPSFKVFGVEMVFIASGPFYLGDGSDDTFFVSEADEISSVRIESEDELVTTVIDPVSYDVSPITFDANYPKGYDPFFMMKYEVTQGQYVDFLNAQTLERQRSLVPSTPGKKYVMNFFGDDPPAGSTPPDFNGITVDSAKRNQNGSLRIVHDLNNNGIYNEEDDGANLACNQVYTLYMAAYLDWAHMRPMTILEYEKACRGFDTSVPGEYAWGTSEFSPVTNITDRGTSREIATNTGFGLSNLKTDLGPMRVGFAAAEESSRISSGGSFFGVQNLSDNLAEYVVYSVPSGGTISLGADFQQGDGILTDSVYLQNHLFTLKGGSFYSLPTFDLKADTTTFEIFIRPTVSGNQWIPSAFTILNGFEQYTGFRGVRTIP